MPELRMCFEGILLEIETKDSGAEELTADLRIEDEETRALIEPRRMSYAGTAGDGTFDRGGRRVALRTWRKIGRIFVLRVKKFSKKEQMLYQVLL